MKVRSVFLPVCRATTVVVALSFLLSAHALADSLQHFDVADLVVTGTSTSLANGSNGTLMLDGFGASAANGKETMTGGTGKGPNTSLQINLSAEASANSSLGEGGLEQPTSHGMTWVPDYTVPAGLGLVNNASGYPNSYGTSGLLSDLDQTYPLIGLGLTILFFVRRKLV